MLFWVSRSGGAIQQLLHVSPSDDHFRVGYLRSTPLALDLMKLSVATSPSRLRRKYLQRVCSSCKRKLLIRNFHLTKSKSHGKRETRSKRRARCRWCRRRDQQAQYGAAYAAAKKKKDVNYLFVYRFLARHPCADCGEKDFRVLEFHHIDPKNKSYSVARLFSRNASLKRIKEEIEKCEVLCANCHKIRTAEQTNTIRSQLFQQVNEEVNG